MLQERPQNTLRVEEHPEHAPRRTGSKTSAKTPAPGFRPFDGRRSITGMASSTDVRRSIVSALSTFQSVFSEDQEDPANALPSNSERYPP